jgi:hypothetical protein
MAAVMAAETATVIMIAAMAAVVEIQWAIARALLLL